MKIIWVAISFVSLFVDCTMFFFQGQTLFLAPLSGSTLLDFWVDLFLLVILSIWFFDSLKVWWKS